MNTLPRYARDLFFLMLILVVAALLRLTGIAHPDMTMFDEVIYKNYITMTLAGQPSFDIHPPLAKLLMLEVAKGYDFPLTHNMTKEMVPFGSFPYVPLRSLVALFGMLLPVFVYGIGRKIGYSSKWALVPALFVACDSALILYSRVMLPDMILLTMNFAGIFFAISAAKARGVMRYLYTALAICSLAAAFSIKWTALGILATALAIFIRKKMWWTVIGVFVMTPLVYIGSFLVFFQYFPSGGSIAPMFEGTQDPYNIGWITSVEFPHGKNLADDIAFLPTLHRTIIRANTDSEVNKQVFRPEGPRDWPLGKSSITFWHQNNGGAKISLTGNIVLWSISFLLLCYECCRLAIRALRKKTRTTDGYELLLVFGFLVNYVPFFFIARPMYIYHYFPALILLFLLIPKLSSHLQNDLIQLVNVPILPKLLAAIAIMFAILCFLVLLPSTYGFSLMN